MKEDKEFKIGCGLFWLISIIVGVISIFHSEGRKGIAEYGIIFLLAAVIVGLYFVVPKLNAWWENVAAEKGMEKKKKENIGCILAIIIGLVVLAVVGLLMNNFETMYILGAIGLGLITIAICVYIYFKMKE